MSRSGLPPGRASIPGRTDPYTSSRRAFERPVAPARLRQARTCRPIPDFAKVLPHSRHCPSVGSFTVHPSASGKFTKAAAATRTVSPTNVDTACNRPIERPRGGPHPPSIQGPVRLVGGRRPHVPPTRPGHRRVGTRPDCPVEVPVNLRKSAGPRFSAWAAARHRPPWRRGRDVDPRRPRGAAEHAQQDPSGTHRRIVFHAMVGDPSGIALQDSAAGWRRKELRSVGDHVERADHSGCKVRRAPCGLRVRLIVAPRLSAPSGRIFCSSGSRLPP